MTYVDDCFLVVGDQYCRRKNSKFKNWSICIVQKNPRYTGISLERYQLIKKVWFMPLGNLWIHMFFAQQKKNKRQNVSVSLVTATSLGEWKLEIQNWLYYDNKMTLCHILFVVERLNLNLIPFNFWTRWRIDRSKCRNWNNENQAFSLQKNGNIYAELSNIC